MVRFLLALAAVALLGITTAGAQQDVVLGGVDIQVAAGYSGFGLPIANSALARDWASRGPLAWQMGFNYSTIPVRVDILHRRANAFRGTIEVITTNAYSNEEDPLGHMCVYSEEVIVPASSPKSFYFAPRVCPPSRPGAEARVILKIYQDGMQTPILEETVSVIQLEPAFLYSLLLDGPPGGVYLDKVNEGNRNGLALDSPPLSDEFFSTDHWVICTDRRQVTGLPLAARDFAFVAADYVQVLGWPEDEQLALHAFMIGGGHLCLYNTAGEDWLGLSLEKEASPVGRGFLLAAGGGLEYARDLMVRWLEGEFSEFALWMGGTCHGQSLQMFDMADNLAASLTYDDMLSKAGSGSVLSHQRGFYHPIWVYREACSNNAAEPWQNPEILVNQEGAWRYNNNLLMTVGINTAYEIPPLASMIEPVQKLPWHLTSLAVAVVAALVFAGLRGRAGPVFKAGAAMLACASLAAWWAQTILPSSTASLRVIDGDIRSPATCTREVSASIARKAGEINPVVGGDALLRHISWRDDDASWHAGAWEVERSDKHNPFKGIGGGSFIAVCSEYANIAESQAKVMASTRSLPGGAVELEFDLASLPPGTECYLHTAHGWSVLRASGKPVRARIDFAAPPVMPGIERLLAWQESLESMLPGSLRQSTPFDRKTSLALSRTAYRWMEGELTWPEAFGELELFQTPSGIRGSMSNQAVLLIPAGSTTSQGNLEADFIRLAIPLEVGGV